MRNIKRKLRAIEDYGPLAIIQGVFEVEAFLLTCDNMRCSKEF
jgi:hypothetical protein